MRLLFVVDGLKFGNAYIRGILPTIGLNKSGIRAEYVVANKFDPSSVGKTDTVVFVKYDRLNQAKLVKDTGARVILDVVDSKKHWKQHRDYLDGLIVNTRSQIEIIKNRDRFDKPILKIPHILTNFTSDLSGQVRKKSPPKMQTVGYLGVSESFTDMHIFKNFCVQIGLSWYSDQPSIDTNESCTLNLDLGCIYYCGDKERVGGTMSITKPSAKLLNMFSYGIPALFSPYESYLDDIGQSGYSDLLWCCCNTPEAMFDKIKIIRDSPKLYLELSDASYEVSKKYHISKTAEIYKDLIEFAALD
jgi:hypothetical protein